MDLNCSIKCYNIIIEPFGGAVLLWLSFWIAEQVILGLNPDLANTIL